MTEERKSIDLSSLVGEHQLSGVDSDTIQVRHQWRDCDEPCDVLRFVLDGTTYEAIEDPSDGYRNAMEGCYVTDTPVRNTFASVKVVGRHRVKGEYHGADDVLELIDAANGKLILEVGTDNVDDYYPSFIANWRPHEMAVNAQVNAEKP